MLFKLKNKFDARIIPVIGLWVFFIRSYIPLWQMSEYNHANADDFWMGNNVFHEWYYTENFWSTVLKSWTDAFDLWKRWDGCFLSMFIGSIPPTVFGEEHYRFTFYLLSLTLIVAECALWYVIFVRISRLDVWTYLMAMPIILLFMTNMLPSIKAGLYWWVGGINYTFFFSVLLISQALVLEYMVSKRIGFLIAGSIVSVTVGMGNLLSGLMCPVILFVELMYMLIKHKKKGIIFFIPTACGLFGLLFNVLAPGNLMRGGSELFSNGIIESIIGTIKLSTLFVPHFYRKTMWIMFLLLALIIWDGIRRSNRITFSFRYPLLFMIFTYLLYCATFTPCVYVGSAVYGRCKNVSFGMQIIFYIINIIYFLGYLDNLLKTKGIYDRIRDDRKMLLSFLRKFALIPVSLFMIIYCYQYRSYFDFFVADYCLSSGQAAEFDRQVMERFKLYENEDLKDVEVKKVTGVPPIFYWDDENIGFLADWFMKDSVTVIE